MKILVIFGLPGAGKTFVGKILEKYFAYHFYDGDQDMSQELKDAIVAGTVTDEMRQKFFDRLIFSVKSLQKDYAKLVISQTFIKEKFREQFLKTFLDAQFILIDTKTHIRENRLLIRDEFRLPIEQWRKMYDLFEIPKLPHKVITNDVDGETEMKAQLEILLKK